MKISINQWINALLVLHNVVEYVIRGFSRSINLAWDMGSQNSLQWQLYLIWPWRWMEFGRVMKDVEIHM